MGRAVAHGVTDAVGFSDPTALSLLPEDARERVVRFRDGVPAKGLRERLESVWLDGRSNMMVARTVAIDEAVRASSAAQVVILGAGLDGRAWRMPELRDVVVFEVDHPDSQREKRARAATLPLVARDVRFVPVDFARDALDDALAAAGHDPARTTTWIWEGVVMYLTLPDIEATLEGIRRRSAAGSHLVVAYHCPALLVRLLGGLLARIGEPLRSSFTADEMKALLRKHEFNVCHDEDLPGIARALSAHIARATKFMKHHRIVTAERLPA
jgi:methyltransferase (TIGR00027 family)